MRKGGAGRSRHPLTGGQYSAAADADGQVLATAGGVDRGHGEDAGREHLLVERDGHPGKEDLRVGGRVTWYRNVRQSRLHDRAGLDGGLAEGDAEQEAARGHGVRGVELVGDVAVDVNLRRADVGEGGSRG